MEPCDVSKCTVSPLGQRHPWRWRAQAGDCGCKGGKRRLLSHEGNTSSDDTQRQACMPSLAVRPSRNTAPDRRVPTNRPAALAM